MVAPRSRGGRWVVIPDGESITQMRRVEARARRRRVRIMAGLLVAVAVTGLVALMETRLLPVHLIVDVGALAFGVMLFRSNRRQAERLRKVRTLARQPIPADRPTAEWPIAIEVHDDEPLFVDVDEPIAL